MRLINRMKKICALIIVLILNINAYAAVGGNDGSAFITKAEFDAIVNTFNEQMDSYENSLVTKIDGAIANYLAGQTKEITTTKTVGYLSIIPSSEESITMQPYDAFKYVGGAPDVKFSGLIVSLYTKVYGANGKGNFSYTGTENGGRRFVTEEGSGTSKAYRWNGYAANYKEKFDITWGRDGRSKDEGYNFGTKYYYCFGASMFNADSVTTNPTWSNTYWLIGNVNNTGIAAGTNCTVNTTWNDYNVKNKYDLMYEDYADADKKQDNLRCFVERNPNNRFFAGADVTYETVSKNATRSGGKYEVWAGGYDNNYYDVSAYQSTSYASSYSGKKFFTCGYEPIASWGAVLSKDTNIYDDKSKTEGVEKFSDYSMTSGAVFGVVQKGGVYTWPVEFTDTKGDTTVWIKYGHFDGAPKSSECINVSVDGGVEYSSATIKNGKGTIKFTAEKNGLLFFKWTKGKSLKVQDSLNYVEVYEP